MKSLQRLLMLLPLLAGSVHAEELYRCISPSGAVSWQSVPCARGARQTRTIAFTPEQVVEVPVSVYRQTKNPPKLRSKSGYRISTRVRRPKPDACRRARERRESTLERVGLKRTYDLLSKLDADVRRVCR